MAIPKVIHYCWFGKNKKSKLIIKCIKSWKRICPEYKIIEWNESNYNIDCNDYVREAYKSKKWAYVADYARFDILNQYGGVYLDTDVELIRSLDPLLGGGILGFSKNDIVATGLIMACEKNNWLCNEVLDSYRGEHFIWDKPDTILAIGRRVTAILVKHGLRLDGSLQNLEGFTVYPSSFFNPTNGDMHYKINSEAFSIHHYAASWFPFKDRVKNTIRRFIGQEIMMRYYRIIGKKL